MQFTDEQVIEMFELRAEGVPFRELGRRYNVSRQTAYNIINRNRHADVHVPTDLIMKTAARGRRPLQFKLWENMMRADLYRDAGHNQSEISLLVGRHQSTVSKWLKVMDRLKEVERKVLTKK